MMLRSPSRTATAAAYTSVGLRSSTSSSLSTASTTTFPASLSCPSLKSSSSSLTTQSRCKSFLQRSPSHINTILHRPFSSSSHSLQSTTTQPPPPPPPSKKKPYPRTILSGIQPTGVPHLGNYLGALSNWVKLQDQKHDNPQVLYSIVDLHAITVPQDPAKLRKNVIDMAVSLVACGIDPKKSILFRQSKSKLQTLQSTGNVQTSPDSTHAASTMALIHQLGQASSATSTATTSEDESDTSPFEDASGLCLGLLAYPVLQAADIMVYRATEVPIGEDQIQHMNLTAMVARSFNSNYQKEVFPIPKGVYASTTSKKIMSLRTPTSKMSKSDLSDQSRINLDDSPDQIRSKIRKSTVDSIRGISYDPTTRPGIANLLRIQAAMINLINERNGGGSRVGEAEVTPESLAELQMGLGNQEFKEAVAEVVVEGLKDISGEMKRLRGEGAGFVEGILKEGEERASRIAERTMRDVRKVVGF
ncbi:Tryptophan--tRNA ligase, mitochondrial [Blyttiomyces sp. JEL0837]|nr:Tryptophan--tRNA ligase, mitochondrial [Blyttiomyces sp. JEL0837]